MLFVLGYPIHNAIIVLHCKTAAHMSGAYVCSYLALIKLKLFILLCIENQNADGHLNWAKLLE